MIRQLLLTLVCIFTFSSQAQAYSYSAAGKEPFLDGWTAISDALHRRDTSSAESWLEELNDELVNLESEANLPLVWPLKDAIGMSSLADTGVVFTRILTEEIGLKLASALDNIDDYQLAKVSVARSKRFLDLLLNDADLLAQRLPSADRQTARQALNHCMKALGSPGLFGAGRQPADRNQFERSMNSLLSLLRGAP